MLPSLATGRAGYLSAGRGLARTMTPMIMQGLLDLLAQAWLTPWTTAVSPGCGQGRPTAETRANGAFLISRHLHLEPRTGQVRRSPGRATRWPQ